MVCKFIRSNKKSVLALILFVTLRGSETEKEIPAQWIVWNIGQGSWLTRIEDGHCYHFDAGGEGKFPYQVVRLCRNFKNSIAISHSDWDHLSFVSRLRGELPNLCRQGPFDRKVSKPVALIPDCHESPWWMWRPQEKLKKTNDASSVYFYKKLLYPGDSPKKFEKFWWHEVPGSVSFLVLAHHGSKTGTSKRLLENLPIKLAIVSARKKKYGHPHSTVTSNLRKIGIPLISTESWGSIHILDPRKF